MSPMTDQQVSNYIFDACAHPHDWDHLQWGKTWLDIQLLPEPGDPPKLEPEDGFRERVRKHLWGES